MAEELIGYGLVLESTEHGPQLSLGAIAASYPPQGGGPANATWTDPGGLVRITSALQPYRSDTR